MADLNCLDCGYDLRNIESERCPECGSAIDRSMLGQSIIPWIHRRRIGRLRAFWRTVNLVTFRPRVFAREMNCPARQSDALRFRWMVVAHAFVPVLVLLFPLCRGIYYELWNSSFWVSNDMAGIWWQGLILLACLVGAVLGLFAVTGAASYFFHPKTLNNVQQNRAIVLSYYSCAPLAYLPLIIGMSFAAAALAGWMSGRHFSALMTAGVVLIAVLILLVEVIALLRSPLVMLDGATRRGAERQIIAGVMLPFLWILGLAIFVVALPGTLLILGVVLFSFRN